MKISPDASVLQAVRKRSSKNQGDVAGSFDPSLSVAAVSMAESGSRPPKTEAIVHGYAAVLELDEDDLIELWWAMQGMVEVEDSAEERNVQRWWRQLRPSEDVKFLHFRAENKAKAESNPNERRSAPSLDLMALSEATCAILRRLLGNAWEVRFSPELGSDAGPVGHPAAVMIKLLARDSEKDGLHESPELIATFACPEPVARPVRPEPTARPKNGTISPDVAWILSSVEAMPARERAAVAGFIHGLREGASLFSEVPRPLP